MCPLQQTLLYFCMTKNNSQYLKNKQKCPSRLVFASLCSTKYLYACLNLSAKHWSISLMVSTCSVPLGLMVFNPTLRIRCMLDVEKSVGLPTVSWFWELGVSHWLGSCSSSVSSSDSESWLTWKDWGSFPSSKMDEHFLSGTCIYWLGGWKESLLLLKEEMEARHC